MNVSFNKVDDIYGNIVINLEQEDYQDKVSKALNKLRKQANVPGFRQGNAPKGFIQKMYGKQALAEELNKLVSDALYNYIEENNLDLLLQPLSNEESEAANDFDNPDKFSFTFDVITNPDVEVNLDKRNTLTNYIVKLKEEDINNQITNFRQNFGTYKTIEENAVATDLIKGVLTEVDGDADKADGIVVEDAILMPSYLKDEDIKNQFVGCKVGDAIVFDPKKGYDNHEAEIASLLHIKKEEVADLNSSFRFNVKEVTRYEEAELNQELFDKVLGKDKVTSEEEFRKAVEEQMSINFKPITESLLSREIKALFVKKMADLKLPEDALKRWLKSTKEDLTDEEVEKQYPQLEEDFRYVIAHKRVVKDNDIKVEKADLEAIAAEVAREQFQRYGMNNIPDDILNNYVEKMLENKENVNQMYERAMENKVNEVVKAVVKLTDKEVTTDELQELLKEV